MVDKDTDFLEDDDVDTVSPVSPVTPSVPVPPKPKKSSLVDAVNDVLENGGEVVLENVDPKEFNETYAKFVKNVRNKELVFNMSLDNTKVTIKNLKDA